MFTLKMEGQNLLRSSFSEEIHVYFENGRFASFASVK